MSALYRLRKWIKSREHPLADLIYRTVTGARYFSLPPVPLVHSGLYYLTRVIVGGWHGFLRAFWHTPLFQSQLQRPAKRLFLYGGIPLISGNVKITLGDGCRVGGGKMNISGCTAGSEQPELLVGDNCDLGWGAVFMVGRRIAIGDNVRLAADCFLAGFSGHAFDAAARARGAGDDPDQIGDIVLEDDVWLGTGVTVLKGVTIGRGAIVGTGSIVTRDLPPYVLAGGNPAKIIRHLQAPTETTDGA